MNKKSTPSFTYDNPWSDMTLDSIADRNHQRQVYFNRYPRKTCMLTKLSPVNDEEELRLLHILPRSSKAKYAQCIGLSLSDLESTNNILLLCTNIANAFDNLDVSFVHPVCDLLDPWSGNAFVLHIWNDNVRSKPIYPGADKTIGDFDGRELNESHDIFKRVLTLQAAWACLKWGPYETITPSHLPSQETETRDWHYFIDRIPFDIEKEY